ncbi:Fis family transcriptional regulator, partial [Desulfobacteraceae bacterium SEEP-SAG9]
QEALALLMAHNYPGNIRELENIIEHAFVICPEGAIEPNCLPGILITPIPHSNTQGPIEAALKSVEAQAIMDALKRNSYNRLATANELGMHKSTLFRKIKTLGIDLPDIDGRTVCKRIK